MTDAQQQYPSRYYAAYDTTATQPTPVTHWYDTWIMSSTSGLPDASDMVAMTATQWTDSDIRSNSNICVQNGGFVVYAAPTAAPTLSDRLSDLSTLCQEHMTSGLYFTPSAYTTAFLFDTGAASQSKMLTSFVAASNGLWPTTAVWKIDDGSFVNMTSTDVINLAKKSQAYIQACYATEADLQTKLQADLTTDITVGWPSNK